MESYHSAIQSSRPNRTFKLSGTEGDKESILQSKGDLHRIESSVLKSHQVEFTGERMWVEVTQTVYQVGYLARYAGQKWSQDRLLVCGFVAPVLGTARKTIVRRFSVERGSTETETSSAPRAEGEQIHL